MVERGRCYPPGASWQSSFGRLIVVMPALVSMPVVALDRPAAVLVETLGSSRHQTAVESPVVDVEQAIVLVVAEKQPS